MRKPSLGIVFVLVITIAFFCYSYFNSYIMKLTLNYLQQDVFESKIQSQFDVICLVFYIGLITMFWAVIQFLFPVKSDAPKPLSFDEEWEAEKQKEIERRKTFNGFDVIVYDIEYAKTKFAIYLKDLSGDYKYHKMQKEIDKTITNCIWTYKMPHRLEEFICCPENDAIKQVSILNRMKVKAIYIPHSFNWNDLANIGADEGREENVEIFNAHRIKDE